MTQSNNVTVNDPKPSPPESVVALNNAVIELDKAVTRVTVDIREGGQPSRTGMAMLRDAADLVKRAVPEVGKLRRRQ